jgi:hypothetical protein
MILGNFGFKNIWFAFLLNEHGINLVPQYHVVVVENKNWNCFELSPADCPLVKNRVDSPAYISINIHLKLLITWLRKSFLDFLIAPHSGKGRKILWGLIGTRVLLNLCLPTHLKCLKPKRVPLCGVLITTKSGRTSAYYGDHRIYLRNSIGFIQVAAK